MLCQSYTSNKIEAGIDEAGRGALAGPVVAAAVILPKNFKNKELNDSKKISKKTRYSLEKIIRKEAIAFSVGVANVEEIDRINILNASFLAMHNAIKKLRTKPELLLIDGNRFNPYKGIPHKCIIKGDNKFLSIAAASVIAKNHRDDIMKKLDKNNRYNWRQNKGYPTQEHRYIIRQVGISDQHRKSFQLLKKQIKIFSEFE